MSEHIREGVDKIKQSDSSGRLFSEALNPHFGFYYTIKKSLECGKTRFQDIELVETEEFGNVLLLDNITQVAEKNDYQYHEPMVHPALCSHPKPESVLIIGGGDGGIAREVLKYDIVKRVELAELDDGVVQFSKKFLKGVNGGAFADPRLNVNIVDGRKYTEEHPGEFDIVIMDMTDPFGPSKMLYTKEFFGIVKRAFCNRAGIFVMHSESPVSRPVAFSCIQKTLKEVYSRVNPFYLYIQMYAVLWSISLSSDSLDASVITPQAVDSKLKEYGMKDLKVYSGLTHASMQVPFPYISQILKRPARTITDTKPDFPDNFIS